MNSARQDAARKLHEIGLPSVADDLLAEDDLSVVIHKLIRGRGLPQIEEALWIVLEAWAEEREWEERQDA